MLCKRSGTFGNQSAIKCMEKKESDGVITVGPGSERPSGSSPVRFGPNMEPDRFGFVQRRNRRSGPVLAFCGTVNTPADDS